MSNPAIDHHDFPFADHAQLDELIAFRDGELDGYEAGFRRRRRKKMLRLCALFRCLLEMGCQGNSIHPSNPTWLAQRVRLAITGDRADVKTLEPLLNLLVDASGERVLAGNNAAFAADLSMVLEGERERLTGSPEKAWKQDHKFTEYKRSLSVNREFKADWRMIKRSFDIKRFQDSKGLIRRSRLGERNWKPAEHPNLEQTSDRFRTAFDFFCWKWFVYAMRGDEPLPEKLSYTITPFGTQIFIPGYWSFDKSRDLDWKRITALHNARGVQRQGQKLSENKRQKAAQIKRLAAANTEAKKRKLRGEARMEFLKKEAGLAPETDDRQVRRWLKEALQ